MNVLLELAGRCEQAAGPDREIDRDIYALVNNRKKPDLCAYGDGRLIVPTFVDAYTASLDAAMTLAGGLGGEVTFYKDGTAKAFVWQPYPMAVEAKAATPALALCAVALRARAETPNTAPASPGIEGNENG